MPNIGTIGWAYVSGSTVAIEEGADQRITFFSGSDAISGSDNFKYDYANNQIYLTGNLDISGTINAYKFETITVTSTDYLGSTKFGNSVDDTHQFTGKVGVGTASPSNQIEIEGSSGDLIFEIDNNASNSANFQIQNGAGNARVDLVMNDGTANTTITMKDQKVGIGDTSPSYSLDVDGNAQVTTDLRVGDDLLLTSDSAILSLGAGADFTITHDGTTGATLAGNPITITSAGAATWSTSAGALTVDAAASTLTLDGHTGVTVQSSNSGEVDITSAANVDINATTGVTIDGTTISIDGTDDMNFTVTSSTGAEDLTIQQIGANDSSIIITAAGTGADAISIDATAGSMVVAPSLADGQTLKLGKNGAVEVTIAPHGTANNEKFSVVNTSGTSDGGPGQDGAIVLYSAAGGIGLEFANTKDCSIYGGQTIVTARHDTSEAIKLHADAG